MALGRAVALHFREGHDEDAVRPAIVIDRDPRLSGSMLEAALSAGICSAGVDVRLLGVVPTPAVAQLAMQTGAVAGLVVSASHNPFYDNGINVFSGAGFKLSDEEEARIETLCRQSVRAYRVRNLVFRQSFRSNASVPCRYLLLQEGKWYFSGLHRGHQSPRFVRRETHLDGNWNRRYTRIG